MPSAGVSPSALLVPVHPESVDDDERTLRWVIPPSTLSFVGTPVGVPEALQHVLDDGTLEALTLEPAAVRTTLADGRAWRDHGSRVRDALQVALAIPDQWLPAPTTTPRDDVLRAAVGQVIDGEVGAYIRSHGGQVTLLAVHDGEVEVQLSGACRHCPASDVTLTQRLESGIRALDPTLRRLISRDEPGPVGGRRMLRLLPTRGR